MALQLPIPNPDIPCHICGAPSVAAEQEVWEELDWWREVTIPPPMKGYCWYHWDHRNDPEE